MSPSLPELSRTRPLTAVLAVVVAALALTWVLAPAARAQEVPAAPPADTGAPAADPPVAVVPPPEITPPLDPAPEPPPPPPPPDVVNPPEPAPAEQAPAEEPSQPAPPRSSDTPRDAGPPASAASTATPTSVTPPPPAASAVGAPAGTQPTTAPLGWDVYDDALFAETVDGDEDAAILAGGGPRAFGGLGALGGPITPSAARDKHGDAAAGSRPNATPVGGSGPGGGGPGPGQSMGLFGGGGGASAGIALLMLLGLACGWSLVAPRDRRAFLTSTATWRPSAYVPPIEHPG